MFTYFYMSNEGVLSFLQTEKEESFRKALAQISNAKKNIEDKIAKCQSEHILQPISTKCKTILEKEQKQDDFKPSEKEVESYSMKLFTGEKEPTIAM